MHAIHGAYDVTATRSGLVQLDGPGIIELVNPDRGSRLPDDPGELAVHEEIPGTP
jgi:hypothetical protein